MIEKPRALPTGPKIEIIDPITWQDRPVPERHWLVADLIPMRNVTMLSGDGGVGKSIVALQLMCACALGRPWLGQQAKPCKVFGLFCEDDEDELHRRLAEIARHYGAELGDLENLQLCSRVGLENSLMEWRSAWEAGEVTWLHATIMNHALEFGAQIVVLDSLHDVFSGDEIRRGQARQFIQGLREIAREIDGAVVMTAHPSLTGRNTGTGESGSTAWSNAVRSRLYLTATDEQADGAERVLKTMKSNYARAGGEIRLKWADGVYEAIADGAGVPGAIKRITGKASIALDMLTRAIEEAGEIPPDNAHIPGNVRSVRTSLWKRYCEQGSITDSDKPDTQDKAFRRASERLQELGWIGVWDTWVWVARTNRTTPDN